MENVHNMAPESPLNEVVIESIDSPQDVRAHVDAGRSSACPVAEPPPTRELCITRVPRSQPASRIVCHARCSRPVHHDDDSDELDDDLDDGVDEDLDDLDEDNDRHHHHHQQHRGGHPSHHQSHHQNQLHQNQHHHQQQQQQHHHQNQHHSHHQQQQHHQHNQNTDRSPVESNGGGSRRGVGGTVVVRSGSVAGTSGSGSSGVIVEDTKPPESTITVIVHHPDDDRAARSSRLNSRHTVSVAGMIESQDYRSAGAGPSVLQLHHQQQQQQQQQQPEPTYQTLTSVNGRMSPPGYSPNSSYATLTPLQPLPPISTMSDKFVYGHSNNVSGSFTVMQNNIGGLGMVVNSPYTYDKMGMNSPNHYSPTHMHHMPPQQTSPISPQSASYSQNGGNGGALNSPQKSMSSPNSCYDSPYTQIGPNRTGGGVPPQLSPDLSQNSGSLHSPPLSNFSGGPGGTTTLTNVNGLTTITPHPGGGRGGGVVVSPRHSPSLIIHPIIQPQEVVVTTSSPSPTSDHQQRMQLMHQQQQHQQQQATLQIKSQSTTTTTTTTVLVQNVSAANAGNGNGPGSDGEEINTKELAQRISAELKRYSIPQAIFAQRVLCRSQGTLSDLLRNPKPWSKLKSGRETFRRMWKWLQEPEYQRMSALRLAEPCRYGFTPGATKEYSSPSHHLDDSSSNLGQDLEDFEKPNILHSMNIHSSTGMLLAENGLQQNNGPAPNVGNYINNMVPCNKRKEENQPAIVTEHSTAPKKPRLVFTDLQRRTLQAIFKETKRPSKEMQVTIARQLGLEPTTVGNFFMNARRRSMDKWKDEDPKQIAAANHHQPPNNHQENMVVSMQTGTHMGNHQSEVL